MRARQFQCSMLYFTGTPASRGRERTPWEIGNETQDTVKCLELYFGIFDALEQSKGQKIGARRAFPLKFTCRFQPSFSYNLTVNFSEEKRTFEGRTLVVPVLDFMRDFTYVVSEEVNTGL